MSTGFVIPQVKVTKMFVIIMPQVVRQIMSLSLARAQPQLKQQQQTNKKQLKQ